MINHLLALLLAAAAPAPPAADSRATAEALAAALERDFVYPDVGQRYAKALRLKAAAGGYDHASDPKALARELTDDVQAVSTDGHLRVFAGELPPPGASGPPGARRVPPSDIEAARWIAPGIAFVRFNLFPDDPAVTAAAARFMAEHADARTIIFDIRTHHGGGVQQMDAIFPWLFAKPTRLVTMETRRSVDAREGDSFGSANLHPVKSGPDVVAREHWTVPGRDHRLFDAKIYVLTSTMTGSAAEHFALAMKTTGRGMLIGSRTAGANHYGDIEQLTPGFSAFVPVGRTFDPATGKDWEGAGVAPDIDVPPEQALVKALEFSGVAPADAARLSAEVAPAGPMVRPAPR